MTIEELQSALAQREEQLRKAVGEHDDALAVLGLRTVERDEARAACAAMRGVIAWKCDCPWNAGGPGVHHNSRCMEKWNKAKESVLSTPCGKDFIDVNSLKNAKCSCGKPATCVGRYEVCDGTIEFGCDDCCGHGNEDGFCYRIGGGKDLLAELERKTKALEKATACNDLRMRQIAEDALNRK